MKEGLSLLCKTGSGLAHAYVKLELKERCVSGEAEESWGRAHSPFSSSFTSVSAESLGLSHSGPEGRKG